MQNAVLATLLVINDELHRDARIFRPARMRKGAAVAYEVAQILGHCNQLPR
jgi:hypothetical protein